MVIGPYRSGKTSLVQTLVDLQARLMDDSDRTQGIDVYETSFDLEGDEPEDMKSLQVFIIVYRKLEKCPFLIAVVYL